MGIDLGNTSNNKFQLWNYLMKKDTTKEEKLKLLKYDLKEKSMKNLMSGTFEDSDELDDEFFSMNDSKLTRKQRELNIDVENYKFFKMINKNIFG